MSELVDDIVALARTPAPTFSEEPRLEWLERRLASGPGRRERDAVGNLIWSWGSGQPRVVVAAHVDTVFPEGTELDIREDGGHLVGPGVGDNAAAVAVAVHVVESLLAEGPMAPGAVAFTVGEEGLGNLRGARQVCGDLDPARVIAVEGHGLDHVVIEHVGSVRARLAVSGPGGHSWRDRGTPSALHALIELGRELVAESVNIGRMSGGGAVNAIASAAEMLVELRSLDDEALSAFEARLSALSVAPTLSLACEVVGRRGAGQIDPGHPLVRGVMAARRGLGLADTFGAGSTDANAAAVLGIPAVGIGCAHGEGMHTVHERIDLVSLETGVRQLEAVLTAGLAL
jgi:tripeptide aminopeptidase